MPRYRRPCCWSWYRRKPLRPSFDQTGRGHQWRLPTHFQRSRRQHQPRSACPVYVEILDFILDIDFVDERFYEKLNIAVINVHKVPRQRPINSTMSFRERANIERTPNDLLIVNLNLNGFWFSLARLFSGEVSEWLKEHAWKVCIRKRIEGSNPSLSAISIIKGALCPLYIFR